MKQLIRIFGVVFLFCCCLTAFVVYKLSLNQRQQPTRGLLDLSSRLAHDQQQFELKGAAAGVRRPRPSYYSQRGPHYGVLNHYYVAANTSLFNWNESVTYTTQGEVTFLDNLVPLSAVWDGPISFAIYTPGSDFQVAVKSVDYLRHCYSLIRLKVTFHFVLDQRHFPVDAAAITWNNNKGEEEEQVIDCHLAPPWSHLLTQNKTFRKANNLRYPINVLRNVARSNAETYYVLASDIELYPSVNLTHLFLEMMQKRRSLRNKRRMMVFVLPVFEVLANETVPTTKTQLVEKLRAGVAFPFHEKVCSSCHSIPRLNEWVSSAAESLDVFEVTKRLGDQKWWEPFYIGTQDDPLFDERLSWEGERDKMTQAFSMCLLDYDFAVLDNAFLVHRPGVKVAIQDPMPNAIVEQQLILIQNVIRPELEIVYGSNIDCAL